MASTTTNYGFTVPTSSDLVKNGATAISTLGQNIDTFLFRPFTRNGVLNSAMNVWQRGTSIAVTSGTFPYTADRWNFFPNGTNNAHTVSRQSTNDTTNLPNIQYCGRFQRNSGQTGTGAVYLCNSFETINSMPYVGKQVTFSFYARAGANFSSASNALAYKVYSGTGTDQLSNTGYTGATAFISATATLTTTWQRFTATATVSSSATELSIEFSHTPSGTASTNDYYEITGVQLELGNQASPYAPATPTYASELAACQRYYEKSYAQGTNPGTATETNAISSSGNAAAATTSNIGTGLLFKVVKRTTPTLTIYDAAGNSGKTGRYTLFSATSNNNNVAAANLGDASALVYSDGSASAQGIIFHYVASAEL